MNKIKAAGIIVFIISIILVVVSINISDHNKINNNFLETINKQKAFTQEISKNIFYIYKNKSSSTTQLNNSIKKFLKNMDNKSATIKDKEILLLWNKFYLNVQKFREQSSLSTPYVKITLEQTIKNIYSINLKLIVKFEQLIVDHKDEFYEVHKYHKYIQYVLFFILLMHLIYVLFFILKTTNNFDILMKKIDNSIKSIDQIENQAEDILEDIELTKDEDKIIQALDELMISSIKLKKLKIDLENLNNLKDKN